MTGKGKAKKTVRLDPMVHEFLERDAKQRGIPVAGLIRAILEGYVQKKTGWAPPYFSLGEKALRRVAHVRFLQATGRLRFIISGSGLDVPAMREKKLLEVCDILDQLNALAAKTKGTKNRLEIHDRIARFYRIFDMMANNVEYDTIKRELDEALAEENERMDKTEETGEGSQEKKSEAGPINR